VGSWTEAVLGVGGVDATPDPEVVLLEQLAFLQSGRSAHRTAYRHLERVPWGRAMTIDAHGRTSVARYWNPSQIATDRSLSDPHAAANLLDDVLGAAITDLLPPTGTRIGAHVSGGLDCTTVACRVQHSLRTRGESITQGYSWSPDLREVPLMPSDERPVHDEIAAREGFPIWHRYSDESGDWFAELDLCTYPTTTHASERYVLPHAASLGIGVMFSGWGGDELASFNGRRTPTMLVRSGRWGDLTRQTIARRRVTAGTFTDRGTTARMLLGHFWQALPAGVRAWRHPHHAIAERRHLHRVIEQLEQVSDLAADIVRENSRVAHLDPHDYQLHLLGLAHLPQRTSGWYQTGRLFGIDYRYPLLDVRVVEAALSLPWQAFYSLGWDRTAFRLMAQRHVPASVAWNVSKVEPAHMYAPERFPPERSTPEPSPRSHTDPGVMAMLHLGSGLTSRPRRPAKRRPPQLIARPDLAPDKIERPKLFSFDSRRDESGQTADGL
jgi:asparagine synthase (glutamine-hydrolysing)